MSANIEPASCPEPPAGLPPEDQKRRQDALAMLQAAIEAVDPLKLVEQAVRRQNGRLSVAGLQRRYDLDSLRHVYLLGSGKAGAPMAAAMEHLLGDRLTAGKIVVKKGYAEKEDPERRPVKTEVLQSSHPLPDERSADAGRQILELAQRAGKGDLVIFLISGGSSALMALPAAGLTLDDIRQATEALLRSGADIDEVNAVRKHLTLGAAGRLAAAAYPAQVLTLIISDVIGDRLDVIASGPAVPDGSTYAGALAVVDRYQLRDTMPAAVRYLEAGAAGKQPETPKPGDRIFAQVENVIIGANRTALDAAEMAALELGYYVLKLTSFVTGEAREVAKVLSALAREEELRGGPAGLPACLLAGGETTVTVSGSGTGGRAQELALAAAIELEGLRQSLVFGAGTDGTDGPTDADGAFADGRTVKRAASLGLDARRMLADNDSNPFFQRLGDLIVTGPTGTNVNDIYGVIVG